MKSVPVILRECGNLRAQNFQNLNLDQNYPDRIKYNKIGYVYKSTISSVVHRVSSVLASLVNHFIKFLTNPEQTKQTKLKFYGMGKIQNTVGVTDCTHVHIQAPHERKLEFVNRRGRHRINVQLVVNVCIYHIITNCVVTL